MQEEILKLYEKIQDQLSQEEFLAEMDQISKTNFKGVPFVDEVNLAREVLKNHGINDIETIPAETDSSEVNNVSFDVSSEDEAPFEMTEDLLEKYNKVKDKITQEEFLARMAEFKKQESSNPFMNDSGFADMVVGELIDEEVEVVSEKPEFAVKNISELEKGSKDTTIEGRVISISNKRSFKTRKGGKGEVCNVELQDNTGTMRTVFWTQNMPLLKKFNEGDIIQIKGVDIKDGYSGLEANLRPRTTIVKLDENPSKFPVYQEEITDIADIQPDTKVNIIARIVRIPTVRSYEKNGKEGKVASIDLQDASGKITYTLWNKNVELIEDLKLEDGDTVKILAAQARERTNMDGISEISLSHWDGRIVKGDFDVPEIEQEFTPIGDLKEESDVSIKGVVVRLQDIKTFIRKSDNTEGKLRNFDVGDSSGSIRVTVWGDDTELPINKGDILKIIGGNVRFDEYTQTGYSMNTNFNTQITINPENLTVEEFEEFEQLREQLRPTPIGRVAEMDEDGIEIDIIGRFLSINDINEFQRDDGSVGIVRSAIFADESGKVQLSLWNERAEEEFEVGDAYQIENARTRLGMYDVDLNIGGGSRLIKLSEEQASAMFIPELSTLEKALYDYKKISDVDEDDTDIIIIGRVIELNDITHFDRDNGDTGSVRNIEIADDTGSIKVVLWNDDANIDLEIGMPIKLQNPRIDLDRDNRLQAVIGRGTTILEPSENELNKLPTYEELKEAIYVPKPIESLLEDDTNVCVTGVIKEVGTDKNILVKCPNCRSNVETTIEENVCDNCGHAFDEPDYTLMVPTRIEDETGEIQATFFDKLAEELIQMKKEDVINYVEDGLGIEDKLQDLNGMTVEIIANVSFDLYNEESRLNPKKIISKYY
ncbi:OB-fold nucleic acid binding domain-containing protein [uncultured Methanobrevibacter sp.]|uniref:OB-fold nucleic acid binding domain-containing protein n=1 Tax=uncultured Methanobrevibacter sp. TaxID=253161 RepID=UPI0025DB06D9|nr:OB-fold nucleic acid binding domain-containing protein [uncultured Methanobrevibacter sp.]